MTDPSDHFFGAHLQKIKYPTMTKALQPGLSDWMLLQMVSIVNTSDFEIPITLTVGAGFVYGNLVGVATYLGNVAHVKIEETTIAEIPVFNTMLSQMFNLYKDKLGSLSKDEESNYIHLKDARAFSHGIDITFGNGGWWRGRLMEVHGFTLGLLADIKPVESRPIGFALDQP